MSYLVIVALTIGLAATTVDAKPGRRIVWGVGALAVSVVLLLAAVAWEAAVVGGLVMAIAGCVPPALRERAEQRLVTCRLPMPGRLPLRSDF